jgi:predicted small integral membrane protein
MTPGTWFFMAVLAWIGFNLFWLGVVEKYVPMWVGAIIATLLAIAVFKYGPRPREEEE